MNDFIHNIDDYQIEEKDFPIVLYSLLSDINRHFKSNLNIVDEIELIQKKGLIRKIMKRRNIAAHANTSGERRELTEEEVNEMIENLRAILFHLCNVASIAQNLKT